jgi:hypothetical protein
MVEENLLTDKKLHEFIEFIQEIVGSNTLRKASEEPTISSSMEDRTISSRNATVSFRHESGSTFGAHGATLYGH